MKLFKNNKANFLKKCNPFSKYHNLKYSSQVKIQIDLEDLKKPLTEPIKGIPDCIPASELPKPKTYVNSL